jgi:nicotinamide riboside kinase
MDEPLIIAIVGAESTGKTTLARQLPARLAGLTGRRSTWVGEHLRDWCERMGRTPRADEQSAIAAAQATAIAEAAASHDIVVCDTTPLMTAVYSRMLFNDEALRAPALDWHRRCRLTLLTALDLPWEADGLQRDGPHVREPVDTLVRQWLIAAGLPWSVVGGQGPARIEAALDALAPLLRATGRASAGLFTRLDRRNAEPAARSWHCELCDDPGCEHRSLQQRDGPAG